MTTSARVATHQLIHRYFFNLVKILFSRKSLAAALGIIALPLALTASFFAFGVGSPPSILPINLPNEPLYAAATVDKPTMALALSVEFPTVGAQYTPGGSTDNTYDSAKEYLGYYDAESCYNYNNAPTETPATGLTTSDYKRFVRSGAASSRRCSDAFSGNFLNWASGSAIDMLRLALSGGDRYIDTPTLTILQRAVIPNGDPICMWNSSNFPAKQLLHNGGGTNAYWGAVPNALITQAAGADIWVANTLNRIYFGTSNTGSCSNTSAYTLGGPAAGNSMESPVRSASALPSSGMTLCINGETGTCSFSGVKEVWYGAGSHWYVAAANNGVNCSSGCNNVFGDPISGTAKKVYYRNYTGTWTPPTTGTLNSDGFFFSRVEVCGTTSGALTDVRDYGLCKQYPSGNFKPIGTVQKYSDQLRLAAFGYLMDQTASYNPGGRYGGVLRAPMKYVGAKTFDTTGHDNTPTGGNPNAEWNANTGVFVANPDGDTSQTPGISGVINYLNKFGRTGPTPGVYKKYDPVGELHYETLRYLQGLQPSPDAVSGITTAMQDGYPLFTTWNDPYGNGRSNTADYSCLKSNIVVVGDVNTHDGNRLPTASAANNIPDIAYWRSIAGKFESNTSGTYLDGQGVSQSIANPNTPNTSMPTGSQTSQIIGSAYWAHTHDIRGTAWSDTAKQRPGLRVKTFLFDVNEYGAQNNANTRRYANQFFMAAKYGGFESDPSNPGAKPYNTYGNPFVNQSDGTNNNDVWQKAADPGEASTYYVYRSDLASPAREVLTAFDEIFSRATTAARSIAGAAAASTNVAQTGTTIYSAKFDTSSWSGDVVAEPFTFSSSHVLQVGTPTWSAAERLDGMTSPATNRKIFIGVPGGSSSPTATLFTWAAIDTAMRANLDKADPASVADGLGENRLNFLRGDRTQEGNPFRVRTSLLGDIVNSNVTFSGPPSLAYTGTGYTAFRAANDTRKPAVFAGANDGMLHAFDAANGNELFAYIPSWMGPRLSAIAGTSFTNNHQVYVDAPSVVGEAQVASAGAATDWKTVLVSGTGGGGPGVFALDVSKPENFDASHVMWEFTRSDDEDMGQVVGVPKILKLRISATAYRWFAVVASGVNNYVPDAAGLFSSTGKPALFLLALDKPAGTAWALGTNYYKISLPVDSTLDATHPSGLVNFTPLYGSQGEVTDIYMGDLRGNLWKLAFTGIYPANWDLNHLSFFNKGTSGSPNPYPMYIARDASSNLQPITSAPTLFQGPIVSGIETFYVVFGTGKYLEAGDKISSAINTMYAVFDNGSTTADASPAGSAAISGRGRLVAGTVNTTTHVISVADFLWGRAASDADTAKRSGWYFDFPVTGEKLVSSILDLGDFKGAFNTLIPGSAVAAGSCGNNPGSSNQYVISVNTGDGNYTPHAPGLLGPALFLTDASETSVSNSDSTGRRVRTFTKHGVSIGSDGPPTEGTSATVTEFIGRLSWRQINNYQDMKNGS